MEAKASQTSLLFSVGSERIGFGSPLPFQNMISKQATGREISESEKAFILKLSKKVVASELAPLDRGNPCGLSATTEASDNPE